MQHQDEQARLAAVARYDDDKPWDPELDGLVEIVTELLDVPVAAISLVGADEQVFRARTGTDLSRTPRDQAFCNHTIQGDGVLAVEDAEGDERFADNPLVVFDPGIRAYAGAPLVTHDGHAVGALCAIDVEARDFSEAQRGVLEDMAQVVMEVLEIRRRALEDGHEVDARALVEAAQRRVAMLEATAVLRATPAIERAPAA